MSESESEDDKIINKANRVYVHNFNVNIVDGEDHPYAVLNNSESETGRKENIIYNIKRSNNKIDEMHTLEKAIENLKKRQKAIDDKINSYSYIKWFTSEKIANLMSQSGAHKWTIIHLEQQLEIYKQLQKSGGKRKTKKYNFRRRKTKKT